MPDILSKLNYKNQERIAVINPEKDFLDSIAGTLKKVKIDKEIDPRFPYGFIIIFAKSSSEVEHIVPAAIHNLIADGILWFCYPKKSSRKYNSDLERDHGWKALNDVGFHGIRLVSVDENWSALRFRNVKYIKSTSDRFAQ